MGCHDRGQKLRLTLYTKPDCGLCGEAKTTLLALTRELTFDLVEIDITTDATLYETFREEIPVGFVDGRKLFKYRVDPALLRRQFHRRRRWFSGRWSASLRRESP
jgi:glutaredoxin